MLKSYDGLKMDLKNYKAPDMKIKRMTEAGEIIKLNRNLYETDVNVPGYMVAAAICNPSYLSFEYALSYYGLIPEAVYEYTSATCSQHKRKAYSNTLGRFSYQDIPIQAFPYEICVIKEQYRSYLIASPEKALCDKLYSLKPIHSKKEMHYVLFEDLRIDQEDFRSLDFSVLKELCPLYRSTSLKMLLKVVGDYE